MLSDDVLIEVKDLKKCYEIYTSPRDRLKQLILPPLLRLFGKVANLILPNRPISTCKYYREFWALDGVSFRIRRGETFGIIGKNGSGKSTLLQILAGTLTPTSGEVKVNGRVAALLELGSGFNPEFTGKENVFLNAQILGLTQKEILGKYDQIIEFADIGEFIDQPVKTYSSGMFVRLAFAVQAHIDASIVIIDEALAVGDVFFRQKCYARLEALKSQGAAIILVSHAMTEIEQFCEKALLLTQGQQRFIGVSSEASKYFYLLNQEVKVNNLSELKKVQVTDSPDYEKMLSPQLLGVPIEKQITNGQGTCTGVGVFDLHGQPCNVFRQATSLAILYEFYLTEDIGVPVCGVVVKNDRGIIVHGKNSWQFDNDPFNGDFFKRKIKVRQEIQLNLAPGEYVFEVGLA
ncbi:MAG TPA: ABC transporter ATP-binding protein, partial [Methylophilus sp.]